MECFMSIFKMDLKNLFKNPVLIGYNTIFSFLIICIMGFLFSGNYAHTKDAYQYYIVSLSIYGMLNGAMTASNCFMERDIKKPNLRIIYSPAGRFPIYFSKIAASFLFDFILHSLLILVICPVLHISIGKNPAYFLIMMASVEFAAVALGILFCCIFHCEETTSMILSTAVSLLSILGGTFFSLDGMGKHLAFISSLSPVKWLNDAFFLVACDNNLKLFWPVIFGALLLSILFVTGCHLFFKTEDYL